jgi:hypothetical protein
MILTPDLLFQSLLAVLQVLGVLAELAAIITPIVGIIIELRRDPGDGDGLMPLLPWGSLSAFLDSRTRRGRVGMS